MPQVPRPLTLVGRHGDRLPALPARPPEFPAVVGAYNVSRAVRTPDGWVAVGDDLVLGRRVLLNVRPAAAPRDRPSPGGQPGRLWALGHGTVPLAGAPHAWDAYVAPAGAPVTDVVDSRHPVRWPEARPILEQLANDLAAGQKDGTLPAHLSLEQVWVQPDGRPQLLDFPLEPGSVPTTATGLLRQVAATLLEGVPRSTVDGRSIRAPVPRHAARFLARLSTVPPVIASPADLAGELAATRDRPARITRGSRAVQLAVQAGFLFVGLLVMFASSGLYSALLALDTPEYMDRARRVASAERMLNQASTPAGLDRLQTEPAFAEAVGGDPTFLERLSATIAQERAQLRAPLPGLNPAEKLILARAETPDDRRPLADDVRDALDLERTSGAAPPAIHRRWTRPCFAILVWPFLWAAGAFLLRGGLSNLLTGVLVVRATGGRPGRRQAALRALVVWLPTGLLLGASVVARASVPEATALYRGLWWTAAILLPTFLAVALIDPERGPHDRLLRTWLVPR
jgi:hypothetical protein